MDRLLNAILEFFEYWDSTEEGYHSTKMISESSIEELADKISYFFEIDKKYTLKLLNENIESGFLLDYEKIIEGIIKIINGQN